MSAEDPITGSDMTEVAGATYKNITAAGTNVVKSGAGTLVGIINNKPVSLSSITVYDNTAASGNKIGTLTNPLALLSQQVNLLHDVAFTNGLTVVTSGSDDITIITR